MTIRIAGKKIESLVACAGGDPCRRGFFPPVRAGHVRVPRRHDSALEHGPSQGPAGAPADAVVRGVRGGGADADAGLSDAGFLSLAGWPITPFLVRFPFAFFGILAVPAAFFGGRRLFGTTFGLVLAALLAVNSFHIATAREAYFYSTLLFGYFLYFWCGAVITDRLLTGQALKAGDLAILGAALFFSAYSQITGLLICAAAALLFFGLLFFRQRKTPVFKRNLISLVAVHAVLLAPVAIASWGLRPILSQIGANRERGSQVVARSGYNLFRGVIEALEQFSWGWTGPRIALLIVVVAAAVYAFIRNREFRGLWILYFIVMETVLFSISRTASGANYEARYMSGFFPFFLAALAYGLLYFPKAVVWRPAPAGGGARDRAARSARSASARACIRRICRPS